MNTATRAFGFAGNIYGANFFMATGFHGLHVMIGTIFLLVCLDPGAHAGISLRRSMSGSRRRPGTGTLSMWSGCSCSLAVYVWGQAVDPSSLSSAAH
jgi:hypothetical protein